VGRTIAATAGGSHTADFPSLPSSVPAARHLVRDDLVQRGMPARLVEDCLLVVSELVGNAIRHARPRPSRANVNGAGGIRLRWTTSPARVWIAVTDGGGDDRPHLAAASPSDIRGRGLAIVDSIAAEWGVTNTGTDVTVYAVLRP
jgi:anti-sigma regulatory factor (Ser/Thr protein kinase)